MPVIGDVVVWTRPKRLLVELWCSRRALGMSDVENLPECSQAAKSSGYWPTVAAA